MRFYTCMATIGQDITGVVKGFQLYATHAKANPAGVPDIPTDALRGMVVSFLSDPRGLKGLRFTIENGARQETPSNNVGGRTYA